MIELSQKSRFEALGLVLENDILTIQKPLEEPIFLGDIHQVIIERGVSVRILESSQSHMHILVKEDSQVEYQVLFSQNVNRHFECFGDLHYMEISFEETEEALQVDILKEGITVTVEQLSIAKNCNQTYHQMIEHMKPRSNSNISNFGVAMEGANILFDTTGKIDKGMAKSNCVQLSKGIVMDDASGITSKPILLIDEYDVVANHGASIGKMSDEILFYLMSRGLSKSDAFLLILEGIISPFVEQIQSEEWKNKVQNQVEFLTKR